MTALARWPQQRRAARAHPVAHLALQQRLRPDAEAPRAIEHPPTPRALVHQAVGSPRVCQDVECRQRSLDESLRGHTRYQNSPPPQSRLTVVVSRPEASRIHHAEAAVNPGSRPAHGVRTLPARSTLEGVRIA